MNSRRVFVFAFIWAAFVIIAVHTADFPGSVPNFRDESGGGILLDVKPAFTPDEIYGRLSGYGEQGRRNYYFRNVTVDVLLPLSVLPFFLLLASRSAPPGSRPFARWMLMALPSLYVLFDFVENATVLRLLAAYPERLNVLASTLPYTTVLKRTASLLALAAPLAMLGIQFVRARMAPKYSA
jgi:hypothetical protein